MYSREERMKAIELYIKYDRCAADVARELGLSSRIASWQSLRLSGASTPHPRG